MIGNKKAEPKYSTRVCENTLAPVWKEVFVFINEAFTKPDKPGGTYTYQIAHWLLKSCSVFRVHLFLFDCFVVYLLFIGLFSVYLFIYLYLFFLCIVYLCGSLYLFVCLFVCRCFWLCVLMCRLSASIVIKCFDQNRLGARDFEGIVTIDVRALLGSAPGVVEKWLPFEAYKGDIDVSGDLHVQLTWGDLPIEHMEHAQVLSPAEQARLEHKKQLELQQLRRLHEQSAGQQAYDVVKNLTSVKGKSSLC